LSLDEQRVVTAPVATANYIRHHYPGKRCWLLTKGDTARDFADIHLVESNADIIVIGGAEELLTYETMNHAFRMLMDGAILLATGQRATVLGKPNLAFFEQALLTIRVQPQEAVMVGDDIENDIGGAQRAGLQGVLVSTGKHNAQSPLLARIHPDAILASIADLPAWLEARS
jgi:ribonucleotide monophosphatase NagD (HAD superfamily)